MKNFIYAALPWIVMGITVTIAAVNFNNKSQGNIKKYDNDDEELDNKDKQEKEADNNMTMGMCFGMCLGVALGSTGIFSIAYGASFGMLIGMVAGMCIKKK